ncbi:alpha/beta hydrolase family protein [Cellulomonas sp. RIT-PI-Y]|uniref:alpha/beta hydrolase family protein n=1 Tax=Cellulomonas sp. RIT-PI-Y TaxID=3035297 RepID=UPI0021D81069|nr:alpha/beta hydrolase family protein [Cellulomonas sp. RIT-PI-Y]
MSGLHALLPEEYPAIAELRADPAWIETVAEDLLACAINLGDLDEFTRADTSSELWHGEAADAYRAQITRVGGDARAISTSLREAAQLVAYHREDVIRIRIRRDNAVEDRAAYHRTRRQLLGEIDAPGPHQDPSTSGYEDLRHRALRLVHQREELDHDVRQLGIDLATATESLLSALGAFSTTQLSAPAARRPVDLVTQALTTPGSPTGSATIEDITAWWASLTEDERYAVLTARPELLGNTDGIPIAVRDHANRLLLEADLDALEWRERYEKMLAGDAHALANMRAVREALDWGALHADPGSGESMVPLLFLYEPRAFDGDGKAGIAFGDPDHADQVSILVPGMNSRADSIEQYTEDAWNVYESARLSDPDRTVASLAWIGYDAPSDWDLATVAAERRATDGGALLSSFVDGLRSTDQGAPAHLTVIGHSYGSTTVAHAAADDGLPIEDLVLVGSPGAGGGITHATQLGLPTGHVWVGRNSKDPVASFGSEGWTGLSTLLGAGLGKDPSEDSFGATRFRAEAVDRATGWSFNDHTKYFAPESESVYNIGAIVAGNDADVLTAEHTYDPWYSGPVDPEIDREPTRPRDQ